MEAQHQYSQFQNEAWQLISRININSIRDPTIRRRLTFLSVVGPAALPPDQLDRVSLLLYYKNLSKILSQSIHASNKRQLGCINSGALRIEYSKFAILNASWNNGAGYQFFENIFAPAPPTLKIVDTKIEEHTISYDFCMERFSIR